MLHLSSGKRKQTGTIVVNHFYQGIQATEHKNQSGRRAEPDQRKQEADKHVLLVEKLTISSSEKK